MIGVRHVGIVCNDISKSIEFYTFLGFTIISTMNEYGNTMDRIFNCKGVKVYTVKMSGPDSSRIELLDFSTPSRKKSVFRELWDIGISHIAITVGDLDLIYSMLKPKGIRFLSEPTKSQDERVKLVFCQDPDNNILELVQEL